MDGNTSQFIDYLSNLNHENGILGEESLLLSPIPMIAQSRRYPNNKDGEIVMQHEEIELVELSNTKRSRGSCSSLSLEQQQGRDCGLRNGTDDETDLQHHDDDDDDQDHEKSFKSTIAKPVTIGKISCTTLSSITEKRRSDPVKDKNIAQWGKENNSNLMEPLENRNSIEKFETVVLTSIPTKKKDSLELTVEEGEECSKERVIPNWKSALDASACPSLGLGSIETGTSSNCDDEDDGSLNESKISQERSDKGGSTIGKIEDVVPEDYKDDEKQSTKVEVENSISFNSSLLSHSMDESLQDSMEGENQDDNYTHNMKDVNDHHDQEECFEETVQNNVDTVATPSDPDPAHSSSIESRMVPRVTISPKEPVVMNATMVDSNLDDNDTASLTPHSTKSNTGMHVQDDEEKPPSPSSSIQKIRLGLTPRLKKLRSKLIRESMQGNEGYEAEWNGTSSTTPNAGEEKIKSEREHGGCRLQGSELSLTPALKSFRSKLIRDSLSIGDFEDNSIFYMGSQYDDGSPNADPDETNTNTKERIASFVVGNEYDKENVKPRNISDNHNHKQRHSAKQTTQYPVFQQDARLVMSPDSLVRSSIDTQHQFLTPSLRQSTATNGTTGSSKPRATRHVVFEDDLYLDQPMDLSSAKKNLNAQSSALVERLRGAAQKRMMNITRSRDSLAAKENMHQEQQNSNSKVEELPVANDVAHEPLPSLEAVSTPDCDPVCSSDKVSREVTERIGVPPVKKKAPTVPISPKLGPRRDPSSSTSKKTTNTGTSLTDSMGKDGSTSIAPLPAIKRKPLTIPKSPLLGARRKPESSISVKPKASLQVTQSSPTTNIPNSKESLSPVGLEFLTRTPPCPDTAENGDHVVPFTLHTQIRAKERAQYDASRSLNEKLRNEAIKKERDRLLKEKYKELEGLKKKLR